MGSGTKVARTNGEEIDATCMHVASGRDTGACSALRASGSRASARMSQLLSVSMGLLRAFSGDARLSSQRLLGRCAEIVPFEFALK